MNKNYLDAVKSINDAVLQSETLRTRCVLIVLGFISFIGLFRIFSPIADSIKPGVVIFFITFSMIFFELYMLRDLVYSKKKETKFNWNGLRKLQLVLECLFPIIMMFSLYSFADVDPYLLIVSPGYALIMIILAASVLRLDVTSTFLCGLLSTITYALFVLYVVNYADMAFVNPYPKSMYFNMIVMLLIASYVAVFVTRQMQNYLESAIEEIDLKREHDLLQRDLDIAEEIQQSLLPESVTSIDGYELAAFSRAADKAGGDYYDWRLIDNSRLVLSVADVTGHGIGPALVTTACRAYVRAILDGTKEIDKLIHKVNGLLHGDVPAGKFVTFGLLDLQFKDHTATFLSAGHAPHIFIKGNGGEIEYIEAQGIPFGISETQELENPIIFNIDKGDVLVMFTDGVYELSNIEGKQLGLDAFVKLLVDNRHLDATSIIKVYDDFLKSYLQGNTRSDDMTMVVLKRT
jgi:serine phosphatase RsbU (regulator of sigma subunit)